MNILSLALPLLYFLLVLGLCAFLLVRGITHGFIGLFAGGALLHLIQSFGFLVLHEMPGGFSANTGYLPILSIFATLGTVAFAAGFVLLTSYLLRGPHPEV